MSEQLSWDAVSEKTIWELLSTRQRLDVLVQGAPYGVAYNVLEYAAELNDRFSAAEMIVLKDLDEIPRDISIDDQVEMAKNSSYPKILLAIMDGQNYADLIWQEVKPDIFREGCFCE